jgi:hypothetical protein
LTAGIDELQSEWAEGFSEGTENNSILHYNGEKCDVAKIRSTISCCDFPTPRFDVTHGSAGPKSKVVG